MVDERSADVAIIGGGVIGCSIAWHLAASGCRSAVVLEKKALASGATGICPGGIRLQFEGEADCRWAAASMPFWESINEILAPEHPFVFERSGYLFVAHEPATLQRYRANVARQNELGIPSQILDPAAVAELLPALDTASLSGAAFCDRDGFIEDCHGVTHQLAARAGEHGVRVLFEEATAISRCLSGWQIATRIGTRVDRIACGRLILAAGLDSVPLAAAVGLHLPLQAQRRRLAFTAPHDEAVMAPLVVAPDAGFAGKQLGDGPFYLGWLRETGEEPEMTFLENALTAGAELLPLLADLPVRRVLAGLYDSTPDHRPLLGGVDGFEGLGLAVGFSGHGYMLAPAVGEALACWATDRQQPLPLAPFAMSRLSGAHSPTGAATDTVSRRAPDRSGAADGGTEGLVI